MQLDSPGTQPTARYGHAAALIDLAATDASQCTAERGWAGELTAGQTAVVRIRARDSRGYARLSGGDEFDVAMSALGCREHVVSQAAVTDHGDGSYT